MSNSPPRLGVLDWGIGGIGVVSALRREAVNAPILYVSDAGVTPYGRMSRRELRDRVQIVVRYLRASGCDRVLIACNAASTAIDELPDSAGITGMIAPTLAELRSMPPARIGIIGGVRTIRSGRYRRGACDHALSVTQRVAQPISAHVEAASTHTREATEVLRRVLRPMHHVDVLVLGCTHYAAITGAIQAHVPRARIVDPSVPVARSLALVPGLRVGDGSLSVVTTGDPQASRTAAALAWGVTLDCHVTTRI